MYFRYKTSLPWLGAACYCVLAFTLAAIYWQDARILLLCIVLCGALVIGSWRATRHSASAFDYDSHRASVRWVTGLHGIMVVCGTFGMLFYLLGVDVGWVERIAALVLCGISLSAGVALMLLGFARR